MKNKRRKHEKTFKARVALEALKGEKTIAQIATEYEIHPVQVAEWKKILSTRIGEIFESSKGEREEDFRKEREKLHTKIGELTIELDFLEKKSKQLGL